MNATLVPVTRKQVDFIATLCKQRNTSAVETQVAEARAKVMARTLSKQEASALITLLLAQPRLEGAKGGKAHVAKRDIEDGIYVDNGTVFKVYVTVHGNRQQCVKRLEVSGTTGKFVYMGLAVKHLPTSARLMTLEEAKAFGKMYGFCVKCGRTLTDEVSIASGIGPVCGQDGQWGKADGTIEVPAEKEDPNACAGGKCTDILSQCSKHSQEYQRQYGRAANE